MVRLQEYTGVHKMLIDTKFPINIRGLRFVVLDLLQGFVEDICEYQNLLDFVEGISTKSISRALG